jgi:NADH-quinone oxidoreductase subunit E
MVATTTTLAHSDHVNALSEAEIAAIDAELAHMPYRQSAAIEALRIVQAHRGWVSDESLRAVARYLEMSAEELDGIDTFYNLIFRRPVGERVILLCDSVSCWMCGADRMRERIRDQLGIAPGETTADGRFTLITVPCLGACDRAPVMMVGDALHTDIDEQALDRALAATPAADGSNGQ